ncbi:hydroxyacid dehydrogenase [Brachybacterium sp. YJGR34]|uniref:hydroxyacid dehydrogenase n=1 Tax=Brachybacterium sp. YJGR34 TaxID=2059911 RepID=UPI000E0C9A1C|nr:hydroxyacid dehydrogenase [Brachybacterium sp. YJGR34]
MRTLLALPAPVADRLLDAPRRRELAALCDPVTAEPVTALTAVPAEVLAGVKVVVTGWGSPRIGAEDLAAMPDLRALVHTAGTVRSIVSDALWEREDIVITTAAQANAVPVAEYTLAQILLAGKQSLRREAQHRARHGVRRPWDQSGLGNHGAVVGLIGASRIGRLVAELLRPFDLTVLISDPYVPDEEIRALGATPVTLPELFSRSDVVSLHAPDVPSTRGMIDASLLARMHDGATFLNTARPALVELDALRAELVSGRLSAVLDVHDDLAPDDPLWDVPTVSITPHIAGSLGNEIHRMADHALEELRRLRDGEPPRHPVDRAARAITA